VVGKSVSHHHRPHWQEKGGAWRYRDNGDGLGDGEYIYLGEPGVDSQFILTYNGIYTLSQAFGPMHSYRVFVDTHKLRGSSQPGILSVSPTPSYAS
jgi:hypothetical protein